MIYGGQIFHKNSTNKLLSSPRRNTHVCKSVAVNKLRKTNVSTVIPTSFYFWTPQS